MDAVGLTCCLGPSVPVRHTGRKMRAPLTREEKSGKSRSCRLKSPVRWLGRRKGLWEELFWGGLRRGPSILRVNLKPRPPKERRRGDPGCPPDKVAKEKSKPAPLETTRMRHPTLFLHSICRPPAGCGEGHGLPRSLRPGEAHGTQNARSVADVRAARTEEKAGHSGRDGCAEEERTHPCKYQRRKGRPPPIYKIQITRQVERACIAPTALGALGMVYPALTGWAKGCRASGAFVGW